MGLDLTTLVVVVVVFGRGGKEGKIGGEGIGKGGERAG